MACVCCSAGTLEALLSVNPVVTSLSAQGCVAPMQMLVQAVTMAAPGSVAPSATASAAQSKETSASHQLPLASSHQVTRGQQQAPAQPSAAEPRASATSSGAQPSLDTPPECAPPPTIRTHVLLTKPNQIERIQEAVARHLFGNNYKQRLPMEIALAVAVNGVMCQQQYKLKVLWARKQNSAIIQGLPTRPFFNHTEVGWSLLDDTTVLRHLKRRPEKVRQQSALEHGEVAHSNMA